MPLNRVVITGMGAVSPYGLGLESFLSGLRRNKSGVRRHAADAEYKGLRCAVAGLVGEIDQTKIARHFRRSMSRMSVFATLACQEALAQAGLGAGACADGRTGVVIGSTVGSTLATEKFFADFFVDRSLERMRSTLFFQIMNHSCAANVAQALGISGRLLAPAAACATGVQAVGYGFEMVAMGRQERMLCGGADEFHPLTAATFDIMNAASSRYNDRPDATPRPFDRDRDGVVCAEGGGILLLESLDAARQRGASILAEVAGFATVTDHAGIASPNTGMIENCMRQALADGGLAAADIAYVNAHATATAQGDAAEGQAICRVFGARTPVSSLKGHFGHAMAASGALELAATIGMLAQGSLIPTRNLDNPDPGCGPLCHVRDTETIKGDAALKNSFALGGVLSSIVVRRFFS